MIALEHTASELEKPQTFKSANSTFQKPNALILLSSSNDTEPIYLVTFTTRCAKDYLSNFFRMFFWSNTFESLVFLNLEKSVYVMQEKFRSFE